MMVSAPVPRTGPTAIVVLWPRARISGTMGKPSRAVEPMDEPSGVAEPVLPMTVT